MHDPETQAALERIQDRRSWYTAWMLCGVASLMVFVPIFLDWHTRNSAAKFTAVSLLLVLILLPVKLIFQRIKRKPISNGWLLTMTYAILLLGMQAFASR